VVNNSNRLYFYLGFLGYAYGVVGKTAQAREIAAELENSRTQRYIPPSILACLYAGLGDREAAMTCLESALDERDLMLVTLKPEFDLLSDSPRFKQIRQRMNLQDK